MCWQLLPAPVFEGQQQRLPPLSTEECMDKKKFFDTSTEMVQQDGVELNEEKSTMEKISKHVWASHVKDEFDLANLVQTKSKKKPCAIAVMDKTSRWIEKEELKAVAEKTAVILEENWRRAHGSIQ